MKEYKKPQMIVHNVTIGITMNTGSNPVSNVPIDEKAGPSDAKSNNFIPSFDIELDEEE